MSNRYVGTLDILKSDIVRYPELNEAVQAEFYHEGKLWDKDNWDDDDAVAHFIDADARYGHFLEVEELCRKLHVPYDGWSEAYTEDSLTRHYRPDLDEDDELVFNGDDEKTYPDWYLESLVKNIDINDPANLQEIGGIFVGFLRTIPKIRRLEEYEGYVHPGRKEAV